MKKIFQLCAVLAVMFAVTGCYNDFDAPKPAKVYTDEDFAGMKHISIADVKQMFLDEHKSLGGTGSNSSWGDTKYVQIGQSSDGLDYYIKGKVQSSDEEGNVYKSLYLVDDSGAIEVKLTTGLYFTYPDGAFRQGHGYDPLELGLCQGLGSLYRQLPHDAVAGRGAYRFLQQGGRT